MHTPNPPLTTAVRELSKPPPTVYVFIQDHRQQQQQGRRYPLCPGATFLWICRRLFRVDLERSTGWSTATPCHGAKDRCLVQSTENQRPLPGSRETLHSWLPISWYPDRRRSGRFRERPQQRSHQSDYCGGSFSLWMLHYRSILDLQPKLKSIAKL